MNSAATTTFFRAMLITMRPYLLFLSGITGLAGIAAAGNASLGVIAPVFIASFLSYGFGQALTDCFQTDTDALSAPYRPLVRGIVRKESILLASLLGLVLCCGLFAAGNVLNLLLGGLAVAGLATYTWFKRRWWGGPWYNAWIVCVLFLMGYLSGTDILPSAVPETLIPLLLIVFSGYANFVLSGYFKDIEADRQTGYNTFPVVFGRFPAALVSDLFAAGAILGLGLHLSRVWHEDPSPASIFPAAILGTWSIVLAVRGQVLLHRNREDRNAHTPIRLVVQSYILMLSAAITALHPWWSVFLVAFYGAFLLVLKYRTEESQI